MSQDPVIVVLWDANVARAYWVLPSSQYDHRTLSQTKSERIGIIFRQKDELTEEAVNRLAWQARIRNYSGRVAEIMSREWNILEDEDLDTQKKMMGEEMLLICRHFLSDIGMIDLCPRCENSLVLADQFRVTFFNLFEKLHGLDKDLSGCEPIDFLGLDVNQASLCTILGRIAEIHSDLGVPGTLLEPSSVLLGGIVRHHLQQFDVDSSIII